MALVPALALSFFPLLLVSPIIVMAYLALGSTLPQFIMIICVLTMLLIWPLVQNIIDGGNRMIGPTVLSAGVLLTLYVLLGRGFDQRHPAEESPEDSQKSRRRLSLGEEKTSEGKQRNRRQGR